MRFLACWIAAIGGLGGGAVLGGELHFNLLGHADCWPHCVEESCCDDYCPKPAPCPRRVDCFQCPDYCPKCPPTPRKVCCFTCDDYCAKWLPPIFCPRFRFGEKPVCPHCLERH